MGGGRPTNDVNTVRKYEMVKINTFFKGVSLLEPVGDNSIMGSFKRLQSCPSLAQPRTEAACV